MLRCFVFNTNLFIIIFLAPVAQKMNSTIHLISLQAKKPLISLMRIHWIVIYPADSMILCFEQAGPDEVERFKSRSLVVFFLSYLIAHCSAASRLLGSTSGWHARRGCTSRGHARRGCSSWGHSRYSPRVQCWGNCSNPGRSSGNTLVLLSLSGPRAININFLITILIHNQEKKLWELMKWSPLQNALIFINSTNSLKKCIEISLKNLCSHWDSDGTICV